MHVRPRAFGKRIHLLESALALAVIDASMFLGVSAIQAKLPMHQPHACSLLFRAFYSFANRQHHTWSPTWSPGAAAGGVPFLLQSEACNRHVFFGRVSWASH